jgi:molybdenum cofactor biosynthesis enzyme MoaA
MQSKLVDSYRRQRGYAKLPWGIDLLLTDACNLRCSYVFESSFQEVWNGARFRSFRRLIRREKRLPLCHRCPD